MYIYRVCVYIVLSIAIHIISCIIHSFYIYKMYMHVCMVYDYYSMCICTYNVIIIVFEA